MPHDSIKRGELPGDCTDGPRDRGYTPGAIHGSNGFGDCVDPHQDDHYWNADRNSAGGVRQSDVHPAGVFRSAIRQPDDGRQSNNLPADIFRPAIRQPDRRQRANSAGPGSGNRAPGLPLEGRADRYR